MNRLLFSVLLAAACCSRATAQGALDSVVLERTPCYGTCPAYRLTILRGGALRFQSRNRGDDTIIVRDSVNPLVLEVIAQRAASIGFANFPASIAADRALCSDSATDHPTIVLFGSRSKRVEYYTGCYIVCCNHVADESLQRLAQFASEIDTLTRSRRWVRPGRTR